MLIFMDERPRPNKRLNNRIRIRIYQHKAGMQNLNQMILDESFNEKPDSDIHKQKHKTTKPKKTRKSVKPVATGQAFLPGLSRRGRPRSKNPISPTERASESRKRRIEAGVKRIELLLEPATMAELDRLVQHFNISRVELISRLIGKAAKRLQDKPPLKAST